MTASPRPAILKAKPRATEPPPQESDRRVLRYPTGKDSILKPPMPTRYDDIAEKYKRSKHVPWRDRIEQFSLFAFVGDVAGKSILELACGEGHYTRLTKRLGAKRVVGIDLSHRMIEMAKEAEAADPLGIEYRVGDARSVRAGETFDLVLAAYLLNYARTKEELFAMCRTISAHLKPGGRFCTVNNNPSQSPAAFERTRKYGFVKSAPEPRTNGAPVYYTFLDGAETFTIENYYLEPALHEEALREAGFADIEWSPLGLAPGEDRSEGSYWADFFIDPPVILLSAIQAEKRGAGA